MILPWLSHLPDVFRLDKGFLNMMNLCVGFGLGSFTPPLFVRANCETYEKF